MKRFQNPKPVTILDLQKEINDLKGEIRDLKNIQDLHSLFISQAQMNNEEIPDKGKEKVEDAKEDVSDPFLNLISKIYTQRVMIQKHHIPIKILVQNEYVLETIALFDTGAALNCIKEGLIKLQWVFLDQTKPH